MASLPLPALPIFSDRCYFRIWAVGTLKRPNDQFNKLFLRICVVNWNTSDGTQFTDEAGHPSSLWRKHLWIHRTDDFYEFAYVCWSISGTERDNSKSDRTSFETSYFKSQQQQPVRNYTQGNRTAYWPLRPASVRQYINRETSD
jgi:hypothetical protein